MKKILIIGSGSDLDGRALGARIDAGEWQEVWRINKHYGDPADVGTRCDVAVSVYRHWLKQWGLAALKPSTSYHTADLARGIKAVRAALVGVKKLSTGAHACMNCRLLNPEASICLIGFGSSPGAAKCYTQHSPNFAGQADTNTGYEFEREAAYISETLNINWLP